MNNSDLSRFVEVWKAALSVYGQAATATAVELVYRVLERYELHDIERALAQHLSDPDAGKFAPKPADVIGRLKPKQEDDGRPGSDEAWALCPQSEADTVVWTREISEAWGVADALMPDKIAARMAFKQSYERLVNAAREAKRPVHWFPSLGYDVSTRGHVLQRAVEQGRLTQAAVVGLLPDCTYDSDTRLALSGPAQIADCAAVVAAKLGDFIEANRQPSLEERKRELRERQRQAQRERGEPVT